MRHRTSLTAHPGQGPDSGALRRSNSIATVPRVAGLAPLATDVAFLERLQEALAVDAGGADKSAVLRRAADALERGELPLSLRIVPFVPGRRAAAEATHPGQGSSEAVALILPGDKQDEAHLLYELSRDAEVRARLSFARADDELEVVPGWEDRVALPLMFVPGEDGGARLTEAVPALARARRRVLAIDPGALPDRFAFADLFSQRLAIELRAFDDGVAVAGAQAELLVCDMRRCGSLYARLLERLVAPDAARQAAAAGVEDPGPAYHPWFPVLQIGSDKAALYTRALIEDIAGAGEHLSDPGWLMRVGLYLEFLTFLGIAEALRGEVDLLDADEREAFEHGPAFAEIRAAVDPAAWREVWALRTIQLARRGVPRTGPVAATNLLAKKRATLRFLHVHHDDLKHAIRLAGPNHHNAQETWQRVFRDAERAVLRNVGAAFPELDRLAKPAREFVLWHRKGRFESLRVPGAVSGLFADQDGLYPSACSQYRESMNDVAEWAKARGLMDHTGAECVPRQVSLLEAHVNQPARVALLQRHDGYGPDLEVGSEPPATYRRPAQELKRLLADVPLLAPLPAVEREHLARAARPLTLAPTERLVRQGQDGDSLFVLAEGELEVLVRRGDGEDVLVDTMAKGAVAGEMSLLTGEPRSATVRARDGAVVYEIGADQFARVLEAHPELVDVLAQLMAARLRDRRQLSEARTIARQIRAAFGAERSGRKG